MLKVAPFGFTIASALRTKAQVICARSKENVSVLGYFITSSSAQKQKTKTKKKLTVNFLAFPWVKFHKIWQVGNKHFTLVEARQFFREIYKTGFVPAAKDTNLKKSKKLPLRTLLFRV